MVRWKPLREQATGWEPDLDDGVRVNVRPFMHARPLVARSRKACRLRVTPNIGCEKDRATEPERPRDDFPWFWGWDGVTGDFTGRDACDGQRWNDLHYSIATNSAARARAPEGAIA